MRACDVPGCDGKAGEYPCQPEEQPKRDLWLCDQHTRDLINRYPYETVRKKLAARLRIPPAPLKVPRPRR